MASTDWPRNIVEVGGDSEQNLEKNSANYLHRGSANVKKIRVSIYVYDSGSGEETRFVKE